MPRGGTLRGVADLADFNKSGWLGHLVFIFGWLAAGSVAGCSLLPSYPSRAPGFEVKVRLARIYGPAVNGKATSRRSPDSPDAWRAGRLRSPQRLLVLLACGQAENERLQEAWVGQAIDVLYGADLAVALARIGQSRPDMVVVGDAGGRLGPVDFLVALRQVDADTAVIVGLDDARPELGAEVLAAGATAVVRRPFSPEVVLRLMDSSSTGEGAFRVRPLPIDVGRLRVDGAATRIWVDGVETLIPAMEFLLLRYLAERHGEIVTREELVSAGWGAGAQVPSNSLNVHLARIRRRFPADRGVDWLRPVRGIGYQLIVPPGIAVTELPAATGS
jgi:DNA-binding response OmpR family regulator